MPSKNPGHKLPQTEAATSVVPWERVEKFVGQVSHDLRNGLNACELQLTFLAEISTDPEVAEEIKSLRTTLGSLTKQLHAIRVATGAVKPHTLEYPAAELFEDLQEKFWRSSGESGSRVEWKNEVGAPMLVQVDPEITLTAGMELLHNALQFADAGTPVLCVLREKNGQVRLCVEETLQTVAGEPDGWGRAPLESTRRGAYGLGLFRTRRGLEAQGSQLVFQHDTECRTLVATVTLPQES